MTLSKAGFSDISSHAKQTNRIKHWYITLSLYFMAHKSNSIIKGLVGLGGMGWDGMGGKLRQSPTEKRQISPHLILLSHFLLSDLFTKIDQK